MMTTPDIKDVDVQWPGPRLDAGEAAMWSALSLEHRTKAIRRIDAIERWMASEGTMDVRQAAEAAGVKSVSRMYEMAKAWREKRTLASLGTFAGAPKTRVGRYDGVIRELLASVVDADPEGSVRKLALDLEAASDLPSKDRPSHNTFRRYVEEEKRRRQRSATAGEEIMLDCSACLLTPSETTLFWLFVIIDRRTQAVLGAALGDVRESRLGYASAAADYFRRRDEGLLNGLAWVDEMARAEIVVGLDRECWEGVIPKLLAAGVGGNPQLATREGSFGRYLRPLTGLRIGTLTLLPRYTRGGPESEMRSFNHRPLIAHREKTNIEVDEYNAAIFRDDGASTLTEPPRGLNLMLDLLARD